MQGSKSELGISHLLQQLRAELRDSGEKLKTPTAEAMFEVSGAQVEIKAVIKEVKDASGSFDLKLVAAKASDGHSSEVTHVVRLQLTGLGPTRFGLLQDNISSSPGHQALSSGEEE